MTKSVQKPEEKTPATDPKTEKSEKPEMAMARGTRVAATKNEANSR